MSLLAVKPMSRIIRESEGGAHHLKRTLGPLNLILLGIGASINARNRVALNSTKDLPPLTTETGI